MLLLLLSLLTVQNGWAAGNPCSIQAGLNGVSFGNKLYKRKAFVNLYGSTLDGLFLPSFKSPSYCCSQTESISCSAPKSTTSNSGSSGSPTCADDSSKTFRDYTFKSLSNIDKAAFVWLLVSDNSIATCCSAKNVKAKDADCTSAIAMANGTYNQKSSGTRGSLSGSADEFARKVKAAEDSYLAKKQEAAERKIQAEVAQLRIDSRKKDSEELRKFEEKLAGERERGKKELAYEDRQVEMARRAFENAKPAYRDDAEANLKEAIEARRVIQEEQSADIAETKDEIKKINQRQKNLDRAANYDASKECGNYGGTSCRATDNINAAANTAVTQMNNVLQMDVENRNAEAQSAVTQKGLAATQEDALRANAQAAWNGANAAQNSAMAQGAVAAYKGVRAAQHAGSKGKVERSYTEAANLNNARAQAIEDNPNATEEDLATAQGLRDAATRHIEQGEAEVAAQSEKAGAQVVETGNTLAGMATKIFEAIQGKKAQKSLNKMADELPANQGTGFTFWNPNSTDTNTGQDQMQVAEVPMTGATSNLPIDDNVVAPTNTYDPSQLDQGAPDGSASPYAAGAGAAPGSAGLSGLGGGGGGTSAAQNEEKTDGPIKNGSAGKYAAGEGGSKARGGAGAGGGAKVGADGMLKSLQDLMNQALADKKEEIKQGVDPSQRDIAAEGSYVHGRDTNIFKKVTESYQRHAPELPSS